MTCCIKYYVLPETEKLIWKLYEKIVSRPHARSNWSRGEDKLGAYIAIACEPTPFPGLGSHFFEIEHKCGIDPLKFDHIQIVYTDDIPG